MKKVFYRASPKTVSLKKEYRKTGRELKKLIRKLRLDFEKNLVNKCKQEPKLLYSYINGQKQLKENIKNLKKSDGTEVEDGKGIAECLSEQYASVFSSCTRNEELPTLKVLELKCEKVENLNYYTIVNELKSLNKYKSTGPDGMLAYVLHECAESIAIPIEKILNKSLDMGKLPESWKEAPITPIFKSGKKTDPANYRPVSLTAITCKVMEKIIKRTMVKHIMENELLSPNQHGFTSNKSCVTNLLETIDSITEALNQGYYVVLILLDFAKAFDTVPHEELILKIRAFGFD